MEKKKSNWFYVPRRGIVYVAVILILSVIMLMPWAYTTFTGGGTSWESVMTLVVTIGANLLLIFDCFRK